MSELKVPLAFNSENYLVTPQEAQKGNDYFCPYCKSAVILRKGKVMTDHFAYKASDVCSGETIIHKIAKHLIQKTIDNWKSDKIKSPEIVRKCEKCDYETHQDIPERITHAKQEVKLESGHIADVLLFEDDEPVAAVEIEVENPVSEAKSSQINLPFVELLGQNVIEDPTVWKPIQDSLKKLNCPKCEKKIRWFKKQLLQISKTTKIPIPKNYYRTSFTNCWRCGKKILIFSWPTSESHPSKRPNVEPIPKTLKFRYSKTIGRKYWVNTCPSCNAIQGNFFLYHEPDEPFFGLHYYEDEPQDYKEDMRDLARYAYYLAHEY